MEGTIYSLIPAVLMLVLVMSTRKIYLSLGTGIIVGAFMLQDFNIVDTVVEVWTVFLNIFYTNEDGLDLGSIYLLAFLFLLGILTAILTATGGSRAFGRYATKHVKTRRGSQLMAAFLGVIIFIDDYFNALAVGQVARPVTDRYHVSRAKLAYIIDSTSAPITVISPISSWGAYIIGTMGGIFASTSFTDYGAFEGFIRMIPLNMYAFSSLLLVFMVAAFNLNVGAMRVHEKRAMKDLQLFDPERGDIAGELTEDVEPHDEGRMYHLIIPIVTLVLTTVGLMVYTGWREVGAGASLLDIFASTNVNLSLFLGGLMSVIVGFLLFAAQSHPKANGLEVLKQGIQSMLPAIYILVLAWMIGDIIGTLETGKYLADVVEAMSFDIHYLPLIIFVFAGFMALSTGTSWGTFGIMLPIAAQIAMTVDTNLVLPAMSAVLAGSVFGDHCSPISDTTILSSTGAGANHIDHVLTQLPYAFIGGFSSIVGYTVFAMTQMIWLSLVVSLIVVSLVVVIMYWMKHNK